MMTAVYALSPSKIKVKAPKYFLPVLRTFVAPIFPEPISLRSFFKKNFVNIKPNGMDPKK